MLVKMIEISILSPTTARKPNLTNNSAFKGFALTSLELPASTIWLGAVIMKKPHPLVWLSDIQDASVKITEKGECWKH